MSVTASHSGSKLALVVIGALVLFLLPGLETQAQERLRRSQQQQLGRLRGLRQVRRVGESPYRDPYRRDIFTSRFRSEFDEPQRPDIPEDFFQRFTRGVETFDFNPLQPPVVLPR